MDFCYKCGAPQTRAILFEVIMPNGIAKICNRCSAEENMPLIKSNFAYSNEVEKKRSVYDRLKTMSGISKEDYNPNLKLRERMKKEDASLRQIVEKNYRDSVGIPNLKDDSLITNFHWIVMRARRARHLTQEQLAREIQEPETAIRTIERGIPPTNKVIINKLESFLKVRIKKRDELIKEKRPSILDVSSMKNFTISDLNEMKKDKGTKKSEFFEKDAPEFEEE